MAKRKAYTNEMMLRDIAKAVIKRINAVIACRKAEGYCYLQVYCCNFAGLESHEIRKRVTAWFDKKKSYEIVRSLFEDQFKIYWR